MADTKTPMTPADQEPSTAPYVNVTPPEEDHVLVVGQWKTGLFDCFNHVVPNCLCSCFCPCITFGQILARLGIAEFIFTALMIFALYILGLPIIVWLFLFYFRYKFRIVFRIPGSVLEDCCATFWCHCCVLAQLATHTGSYTPGKCDLETKATLPGFATLLTGHVEPLAMPVTEEPKEPKEVPASAV